MIAAWMVYSALCASAILVGAIALERGLRAVHLPSRMIWIAALATSTAIPFVRAVANDSAENATRLTNAVSPSTASSVSPAREASNSSRPSRSINVPVKVKSLDRPLLIIWLFSSSFWLGILLTSAAKLHRQSARWRSEHIDGQPVYVSHDVGPALFGIVRYSMVIPTWITQLHPERRRVILDHEREHAKAGDPILLLLGALIVAVQPWNPAIWVMYGRLRFAIESDCDARVLSRGLEPRIYGELLLEMSERTLAGVAPVAALAEPQSHLERRVLLMSERNVHPRFALSVLYILVAVILTAGAVSIPQPVDQYRPEGTAIVRLTSLGIEGIHKPFTILVYADGPARLGIGTDELTELKDTLRLHSLPAMTADVSKGDVHIRLLGTGQITVGGEVTGGPATSIKGTGRHLVLLKGGTGIRIDASSRCSPFDVDELRDFVKQFHPEALAAENRQKYATVLLLFDKQRQLISHAMIRRNGERVDADSALASAFPGAFSKEQCAAGIADATVPGPGEGYPWIVWAINR